MANNRQYKEDILDLICEATRDLSLELLLERLNKEHMEESGLSLRELVDNLTEQL